MFGFLLRPIRKRFGKDRKYYEMLDEIFGIYPNNIELYKLALVHKSASILLSDGTSINNERLEFLGDAVLEAIASDFLFIEFPGQNEGVLTKMRSQIVSRATLNEIAEQIGLADHVVSHSNGLFQHKHLNGDAMEAMIGAIYLDKGYDFTNRLLINGVIREYIDIENLSAAETDYKSRLIEWCQKEKRRIRFHTTRSERYTAKHPEFLSTIFIDDIEVGHGSGDSKKEAEQNAAFSVAHVVSDETGDAILNSIDRIARGH